MKREIAFVLATIASSLCLPQAEAEAVAGQEQQELAPFNWMPEWREWGDCGPSALFVLMKLEGRDADLWELKDEVPADPIRGSSLEALAEASEKFGFPVDVRYVNPQDIIDIPRPFILHGVTEKKEKIGHFVVVVDYDPKQNNLTLIDPVRERLTVNPLDSLLVGYSGYVLLPRKTTKQRWNELTGAVFFLGGCLVLLTVGMKLACKRRGRIAHTHTSP